MSVPLQRYEEIPAVCKNKDCDNFRGFELVDTDEVKTQNGIDYVLCRYCGEEIEV
jgi:hypothetical protein